jgi:hypothetical protein
LQPSPILKSACRHAINDQAPAHSLANQEFP